MKYHIGEPEIKIIEDEKSCVLRCPELYRKTHPDLYKKYSRKTINEKGRDRKMAANTTGKSVKKAKQILKKAKQRNESQFKMNPQPPEGTAKVQQIGSTDSFDCLGFGTSPPNYEMLAVVHRDIGSSAKPFCDNGIWYWK